LIVLVFAKFIHSFKIYIAPLQGNYSEALPTPEQTKIVLMIKQLIEILICHYYFDHTCMIIYNAQ